MSSVILGAAATLKIGVASANTVISGIATGTDTFALGISPDTSGIPGGGASFTRQGQFVTYDFSFVTDANSITDPLLRASHGKRMKFQFDDAVNIWTGTGIFAVTKQYSVNTGRITYSVAVQVDGAPTRTDSVEVAEPTVDEETASVK